MARTTRNEVLFLRLGAALLSAGIAGAALIPSASAEPATCLSMDPSVWPAPSKPYFMVIVDTSGSMTSAVGANSCGYSADRIGHARCAMKNTVEAFGEVNFGLAGYAWKETGCPGAACYGGCGALYAPTDNNFCGPLANEPTLGAVNVHQGANIFQPMLSDHYWAPPPDLSNVPAIVSWVDNNCAASHELGANSNTPLGGVLYNMNQYFSGTFRDPFGVGYPANLPMPSPLNTIAPGERPCRSINVILITDGDETCDNGVNPAPIAGGCRAGFPAYLNASGERLAAYEADRMFTTGVTVGTQNFKIKTHVIGFVGATLASLDNIANCGGTTKSYSTANEQQLSQALGNIVAGAIKPETCDNTDNNCNGCTDEGFTHYCDVSQTCCAWATALQRAACITSYQASITPGNPTGNVALLPCTSIAQQAVPASWLCYDPKDACDNLDNNCNALVDEGNVKCGSPLHCPSPEVCNGKDDNCDGVVDEGCPQVCTPSPEICDGCDNDCDGFTDNGVAPIPCGLAAPPNCVGQLTCKAPVAVPPGTCAVGGGWNTCSNTPQAEVCDGLDNNCNGLVDDGIAPAACVPVGTPGGLIYGGTSQCKQGTQACMGACIGFVGPSPEICDGIDNNCDGLVDNAAVGVGQACGVNQAPCTPGAIQCVMGALVCVGGAQPKPEVCDGIDNNCDGKVDNAPLADAPGPGLNGCWDLPGNCCSFPVVNPTLHWCPPAGANCNDNGTLSPPCNKGNLACSGAMGWVCQAPKDPAPETCDGIDNNCNGLVDDGSLPGIGAVCGKNVGECKAGIMQCTAGVLTCAGSVGPTPEVCDGKDNDCDGVIDNGIQTGGACSPVYDMVAYPGDRTGKPCQPGVLQCDGNGGTVCIGGVGPQPETCDGIDNDCDGKVDEAGMAPNGIDGSANPNPPPAGSIGDTCGPTMGECSPGKLACDKGQFLCSGGKGPGVEVCDCKDNNCDGTVDNQDPNAPPLCGMGKSCVKSAFGCQCASKCQGELGCPGGQSCKMVSDSQSGMPLPGFYCVSDMCGDCTKKTVKDGNGKVICAPAGTPVANCGVVPVCQCKANACENPCSGVNCSAGTVCAEVGPNAGNCAKDTCFNNPCQGCGKVCNLGSCIDDPCKANTCKPGEECKPKDNFTAFECIKPCADVKCAGAETCVAGKCVADCAPACANGKVCDLSKMPPACVADNCNPNPCTADGSFCNPVTGACGNDPCAGVLCPMGDSCKNGECQGGGAGGGGQGGGGTGGGSASSGSSSGGTSTSSSSGSGGGSTNQNGETAPGNWGLATGGGGCACEVGGTKETNSSLRWALVAAAFAIACNRRRRRPAGETGEVAR